MIINPRKSKRVYFIIFIAALIVMVIFYIRSLDKFRDVKSTDLSDESINGISLMQECNLSAVEKAFGKSEEVTFADTKTEGLCFNSEECVGCIELDKENKITSIAVSTQRDTLKTGRGVTSNKSTSDDIIKSYGDSYLKLIVEDDEPGSNAPKSNAYIVTYIDKKNNYKLEFNILEFNSKEEIQYMRLWKYR